jgi:hypothetical protein
MISFGFLCKENYQTFSKEAKEINPLHLLKNAVHYVRT